MSGERIEAVRFHILEIRTTIETLQGEDIISKATARNLLERLAGVWAATTANGVPLPNLQYEDVDPAENQAPENSP